MALNRYYSSLDSSPKIKSISLNASNFLQPTLSQIVPMEQYDDVVYHFNQARSVVAHLTALIELQEAMNNELANANMDLRHQLASKDHQEIIRHNNRQREYEELTHRAVQFEAEVQDGEGHAQFLMDGFEPEHVPRGLVEEIILEEPEDTESVEQS